MIALGIITKFVDGGILGEEQIYLLLGGLERNPILFQIAKIFAFLGSPKFLVPAIPVFVLISIYYKKRLLALGLILTSLGSFAFNHTVKSIFRRPRPLPYMLMTETSFSYPSGHTVTNTCIYLFLAYYFSRGKSKKTKQTYFAVAILFSIIMGLSRVYLGVHYPSDVIGGYMFAYFLNHFIIEIIQRSKLNH